MTDLLGQLVNAPGHGDAAEPVGLEVGQVLVDRGVLGGQQSGDGGEFLFGGGAGAVGDAGGVDRLGEQVGAHHLGDRRRGSGDLTWPPCPVGRQSMSTRWPVVTGTDAEAVGAVELADRLGQVHRHLGRRVRRQLQLGSLVAL